MTNQAAFIGREIKKRQVTETVMFAVNHIPSVDKSTLKRFLDLINATGTFGDMSEEDVVNKMRLTLKYIPKACPHSLLVVADLLEIPVTGVLINGQPSGLPRHYAAPRLELKQDRVNRLPAVAGRRDRARLAGQADSSR